MDNFCGNTLAVAGCGEQRIGYAPLTQYTAVVKKDNISILMHISNLDGTVFKLKRYLGRTARHFTRAICGSAIPKSHTMPCGFNIITPSGCWWGCRGIAVHRGCLRKRGWMVSTPSYVRGQRPFCAVYVVALTASCRPLPNRWTLRSWSTGCTYTLMWSSSVFRDWTLIRPVFCIATIY